MTKDNEIMKPTNALAVQQTDEMSLFTEQGETPVITSLPVIKIIHASALFQMPDDETVKGDKGLEAIVLDACPANAYWELSPEETGGNEFPDCSARDGKNPDIPMSGEEPFHYECMTCPNNQFGSSTKSEGKGKACKNMMRLALLLPGHTLPVMFVLPPTSLKAWSDFNSKMLYKGLPYQAGRVKITLSKKDTYSKTNISVEDVCQDMTELQRLSALRKQMLSIIRGQSVEVATNE